MASEEETPAYIDYEQQEDGSYEGKDLIAFFKSRLSEKGISWLPTVKERTLAKRMVTEYGQQQAELIVLRWINTAKIEHVSKFNYMYSNRHTIAAKVQPRDQKDYGWN